MRVLGLDPSLTDFGWALVDLEASGKDFLVDKGRIKTKSKDFYVTRYVKHREGVEQILDKYDPGYVGIEKPPHNASWSAGLYPIFISTSEVCWRNRMPFATFLPTQVKAFARDILDEKGRMTKHHMVDAAIKLMDNKWRDYLNDNIADAMIIAFGAGRLKLLIDGTIEEEDLTDKEKDRFTKTIKRRKTGNIDKVGMFYKEGDAYYNLDDDKYDSMYPIEPQVTIFND